MIFLIDHFEVFLLVYVFVLIDTILGVTEALYNKKFNWEFLPEFLYTMIRYSAFLVFGNAVEHFSKLTPFKFDWGLLAVATLLVGVEVASIQNSLKKLPKKDQPL